MAHRCEGDQRTRLPLSRHFATTNCCLRSSFSATSEARERSSPTTNRHRAPSIIAVSYQSERRSSEVCAQAWRRREARADGESSQHGETNARLDSIPSEGAEQGVFALWTQR